MNKIKPGQEVWVVRFGEVGQANPQFLSGKLSSITTRCDEEGYSEKYWIQVNSLINEDVVPFSRHQFYLSKKEAVNAYRNFMKECIDQLEEVVCDE